MMKHLMSIGICLLFSGSIAYSHPHHTSNRDNTLPCVTNQHAKTLINPVTALELNWACLEKTLEKNHAGMDKNPEELFSIVKQVVLPMIAIDHMAGLTLGTKWREASKAQQDAFINSFGYMLVRSYATTLLSVSNYTVRFNPLRDDAWKQDKFIQVNGRVIAKSNNKGSAITYYLERSGNTWKIYDISIEGVSFVKNFAAQFSEFPTMKKLLERLLAVNKQKEAK